MLTLLDKLVNKMKTLSKDAERKNSKYWCSCRSISRDSAFVYIQPQKFQIRIFPKLRYDQIPKTPLVINRMKRAGKWGEEYECWFTICNEDQIEDAVKILKSALQHHKHRT
jgi:predicted transport protein